MIDLNESKYSELKSYYGKELESTADLKTNACCTMERPPAYISEILSSLHDEVKDKYYGCGLCIPEYIKGLHLLDLGSGSGRDCYIASALVGEQGSVTGVDMTDEQLAVANKYKDFHAEAFGYKQANTEFLKANIDNLQELGLSAETFDIVISNCVINLVLDKAKVLRDIFYLLKEGGEFYFSDIYADRRIPEELKKDPVLWGECLSGALYWNDFLRMAKEAGFADPRVVKSNPVTVENENLSQKLGNIRFHSVTYRLFKISGLESDCEDYGQAVAYKGTIPRNEEAFDLDVHHHFEKGKVVPVCGNSFRMLHDTRFNKHFEFIGNWDNHFGIFEGCGTEMPFGDSGESDTASCC